MKPFRKTMALLCVILSLIGCNTFDSTDSAVQDVETKDVKVEIPITQGSTFQAIANSAEVVVYNGEKAIITTTLTITDSSVTGTVKNIPAGTGFRFEVIVYDKEGNAIYSGDAVADIIAGKVTKIAITLRPLSGTAIINGTIVEEITAPIIIGSEKDVEETFITSGVPNHSSVYTQHNFGALEWMTLGEHDQQTMARALVKFNSDALSATPVTSAKLALTVSFWVDHSHENTAPMTIAVHKMLKPWNEGSVVPDGILHQNTHQIILDGITNNTTVNGVTAAEASYGTEWNERMIALDNEDAVAAFADTATHGKSEGVGIVWEFDVTDMVNEWSRNPSSNHGILLKPLKENWNNSEISFPLFYTWENKTHTNHGPKLILQ